MQRVWSQLDQSSNERFRCFLMSSNTTITSHDQQSCIGQQNKLSILYDVSQLILCKMRVEWIVYIGQNGIFGEIRNISTIYVDCKQIDHIVHQLSDTEICSITSMYLRRLCIISGINMRCGRMKLWIPDVRLDDLSKLSQTIVKILTKQWRKSEEIRLLRTVLLKDILPKDSISWIMI